MKMLRDAILIIIVGAVIGFGVNAARIAASANGLPLKTPWPDNRRMLQLEIPPSYQPGDSLLSLEDAYGLFLRSDVVFIDARQPREFQAGHIMGAINLPFEEWDKYWDQIKPILDPKKKIVAYCEGLDCELSLFAARELKRLGYEKSYIFFGGWLKWKDAGLPIESAKNG
jgi:rhodanese-related sulfurtransferase